MAKIFSLYNTDKKFEEESFKYLKKTEIFYNDTMKLISEIKEREFQKMGMDTICLINNQVKVVDVKAMSGYIPTFSQELFNINSQRIGWLLNNSLKTDYYLLVYHVLDESIATHNYSKDKKLLTNENIAYTKAILISKKEIFNIITNETSLSSYDLEYVLLDEIIPEYKTNHTTKMIYNSYHKCIEKKHGPSNVYFVVSDKIHEKPVNCIIRRELLEKHALKVWEIEENGKTALI